ncbi:hypothetical protein [Mycobacterium sp.]
MVSDAIAEVVKRGFFQVYDDKPILLFSNHLEGLVLLTDRQLRILSDCVI